MSKTTLRNAALFALAVAVVAAVAATTVTTETPAPPAKAALQSGPMLGYSAMREVMVWAQTDAPAQVHVEYREKGQSGPSLSTEKVTTEKGSGFTAHLLCDRVEPGKVYEYSLFIDGKEVKRDYPLEFQSQTLWQYRTDPPEFTFAIGSCSFINEPEYDRPGKGYGGEYQIFEEIHKRRPDFMVWLGDNTYLRTPDWNTRTGIYHRYTHTRSTAEMQPLLASTHHYATWDDHDFGPNNADRSYWMKRTTLEAFKDFWCNPNYVFEDEGVTGRFEWGDCEFFLLDNRYFRTPDFNDVSEGRTLLGEKQFQWLIDALTFSRAPFKFVCIGGQVLNPTDYYENYQIYPQERERLIRTIREAKIEGVIFLDGDRHHTELSALQENRDVYPLYDLTCSPLTAGTHEGNDEENTLFVEGTLVNERNFALLKVSGERTDRVLTVTVVDKDGEEKWTREIKAKELQYGD